MGTRHRRCHWWDIDWHDVTDYACLYKKVSLPNDSGRETFFTINHNLSLYGFCEAWYAVPKCKGGGPIGKDLMRIGELARQSGVSTRTIDFYTNAGLLDVRRSESNYRLYPLSAVQTMERIQWLKRQRLTIAEIKEVMRPRDTMDPDALVESVYEEFESLQQKIVRLEEQLEQAPTHVKLQIGKALENRMGALASLIALL